MLYIFDKDQTLFGGQRPPNKPEEQVLLPGREEVLARLRAQGHEIAIASNQGGVAWGIISLEEAEALLQDAAQKTGASAYEFCPHDERKGQICDCRKPRPGMILRLAQRLGYPLDQVVYVGDQPSDQQAAAAAGVIFFWADEFFKC